MHAPHRPVPQPNLVPVSPRPSRITHNNGVAGGASVDAALPFTVKLVDMVSSLDATARDAGLFLWSSRCRSCSVVIWSIRCNASVLDDLRPFSGLAFNELGEICRRARKDVAAEIGQTCSHDRLVERGIDLLVQSVDDRRRRTSGCDDAVPTARFVAWQKLGH